MSINEIVSYNLMRARRSQAWTQQDVADLLERYTGRNWSNASVSAAERAWQGGRPRKFDASELVALSRIFDVPVTYFFIPPDGEEANKWVSMKQFERGQPNTDPADRNHDLMALIPTADLIVSISDVDRDLDPDYRKRMQAAVRTYMGLYWRPATGTIVIENGNFGLPDPDLTVDRSQYPADYPVGKPVPPSTGRAGNAPERPISMGELKQIDEASAHLTPEELRRYIRTEARAVAYELYKEWEDQGPPDNFDPAEEEEETPPTAGAGEGWGSYPKEPPF